MLQFSQSVGRALETPRPGRAGYSDAVSAAAPAASVLFVNGMESWKAAGMQLPRSPQATAPYQMPLAYISALSLSLLAR